MVRIFVFLILSIQILFTSCGHKTPKNDLLFKVKKCDFVDQLAIDGTVEALRSSSINCPRFTEGKVIWLIEDGTFVKTGDTLCVIEDQELQTEFDNMEIQLDVVIAEAERVKADLNLQYALLEAQVKNNNAETAIAELDTTQLKFLTPNQRQIKLLELKRSRIEKKRLEDKLKSLKVIQESEIRRQEIDIQQTRNRVDVAKQRLDGLTLTSPSDGLAVRANSWLTGQKVQKGDQIWGNMPLVLIPDLSEMKVMLQASELDYKRMNTEDSVFYTFESLPGMKNKGKVVKKAPVGQPIQRDSKVKKFEIECSMDKSAKLPDIGLSTHCVIRMKTIKDTIVIPQVSVFQEDSTNVIYVKTKKGFEMREVLIGASNSKWTVINTGLKAGESVSLIQPDKFNITKKKIIVKKESTPSIKK